MYQLKKGCRVKEQLSYGSKTAREPRLETRRTASSWRNRKAGSWGTQSSGEEKTDIQTHLRDTRCLMPQSTHVQNALSSSPQEWGMQAQLITQSHVCVYILLKNYRAPPASHQHTRSVAHTTKVQFHSLPSVGAPGCGSLAASGGRHTHTHPRKSPGRPQRFVIFSRSRVPKEIKKICIRKV